MHFMDRNNSKDFVYINPNHIVQIIEMEKPAISYTIRLVDGSKYSTSDPKITEYLNGNQHA